MTSPYLDFLYICWAIFIIYWVVTMFFVKKTVAKKNWFSWGYRVLAIIIVIAASTLFRHGYAGALLWPRTATVGIIADVITLAGLLVALWARTTLGKNWSGNVVLKEDHELITSGPYAYVRHPIYSGILLFVLGFVVYYGHIGGFVFFIMFIAGAWYKAHQEENLMTSHFGEKYIEYKKRVKGLIPLVF